jgi:phage gp16-like protein
LGRAQKGITNIIVVIMSAKLQVLYIHLVIISNILAYNYKMNTSYTCQTRYKTNTNEEGLVFTTEYVAFLDKDGSKVRELDCNWEWET